MRILNYLIILCFFGLVLAAPSMGQTVTKLDEENMEVTTVVSKKISISRLKEERDRLLWQQAESTNRFNIMISEINGIISEFEKK